MKNQLKNICAAIVTALVICAGEMAYAAANTSSIAAPGSLVTLNTKALQVANGMMSIAINPENYHDVYVTTTSGDSSNSSYSTALIMRPDHVSGLLSQVGMVYQIQGLQWVTQTKVDPTGKYVYFYGRTNGGSGIAISVYDVDSEGLLFFKKTIPLNAGNFFTNSATATTGIALTPDGNYIYNYYPVITTSPNVAASVTVYGVGENAQITPLDTVLLPYIINLFKAQPSTLHTVAVSNQFVYVQHMDGSGISTYRNDKGKLTLVSEGANVNLHTRARGFALGPAGKMLYAAELVDNKIKIIVHRVAADGTLEIVNMVDGINGGGTPFDIVVDSFRRYLYVLQSEGIAMYRIGTPSSTLIPVGIQSTYKNRKDWSDSPDFFAMGHNQQFLYTLGLSNAPMLTTYEVTQSTPETKERLIVGLNPSGINWKRISDTDGLTNKCSLSEACYLQFSEKTQSTRVTLIADDAKNSEVSFTVKTGINNTGFDELSVSGCTGSGDLHNSVCNNIVINPSTPWIVNVPAP